LASSWANFASIFVGGFVMEGKGEVSFMVKGTYKSL